MRRIIEAGNAAEKGIAVDAAGVVIRIMPVTTLDSPFFTVMLPLYSRLLMMGMPLLLVVPSERKLQLQLQGDVLVVMNEGRSLQDQAQVFELERRKGSDVALVAHDRGDRGRCCRWERRWH